MKYTDQERIAKIIDTTDKLLKFVKKYKVTEELISKEEPIRWAITTPLYNIGEHTYYLSDEFKEKYKDIPWAKISGLRHRLVHDYDNTNWSIISKILLEELPEFFNSIKKISG